MPGRALECRKQTTRGFAAAGQCWQRSGALGMTNGDDDPDPRIGLAQAIAALRAELSEARRQGQGTDIHFAVGDIEVELALEFGWSKEAGAGFKLFSFVDLSGKAGSTDKTSHKVKLKLTIDTTGNPSAGVISDDNVPATIEKPQIGS